MGPTRARLRSAEWPSTPTDGSLSQRLSRGCHPVLLPSGFPSGINIVDLKPILGLQAPDRVGHCGLVLFGVSKSQVRAIDLGRTLALQEQAVELVQQLAIPK